MTYKILFEELPPTINQLYFNVPGRGRVMTKKGKDWKEAFAIATRNVVRGRMLEGTIKCEVEIGYKHNRDIDGSLKAILDAMQGVAYENDSQIVDLHIIKVKSNNPYVAVELIDLTTLQNEKS